MSDSPEFWGTLKRLNEGTTQRTRLHRRLAHDLNFGENVVALGEHRSTNGFGPLDVGCHVAHDIG